MGNHMSPVQLNLEEATGDRLETGGENADVGVLVIFSHAASLMH